MYLENANKLVQELCKEFEIKVCSPFHIQIPLTERGCHNIWFGKSGLRIQPFGRRDAGLVSKKRLFEILRSYTYDKTDLAMMESVKELLVKATRNPGIYVDAGWKDGVVKFAAIRSHANGDTDIFVRHAKAKNSTEAERKAIRFAMIQWPNDEPIFTDCKVAINDKFPRAVWIPREQNKQADSFGNMRGKS